MQPALAIVTPSYAGDLERFALLCESLDRFAAPDVEHLVMVADHDLPLFESFGGSRRRIISDRDVLPGWFKHFRQPWNGRSIWVSTDVRRPVWPMRGWHVQQIRKLLAARFTEAPVLMMADSDTVIVAPVSAEAAALDGKTRLFCIPKHIDPNHKLHSLHPLWYRSTAELLGIAEDAPPYDDFINNLVTWRRDDALALVAHIETRTGKPLVAALGRYRSFSEYTLFGLFIREGLGRRDAYASTPEALGHTYWDGAPLADESLCAFITGMSERQIAFGVQSFTKTNLDVIRRALDQIARVA